MADEISNKTLAFLLVVAIAISLGGTFVSMNRLNTLMNLPGVTGFATANSTGTANVTITASASIRFAVNNLDFGIGAVNSSAGNTVCSLASGSVAGFKDGTGQCINFSAVGVLKSLQIENDGNVNLTVNLTSTKNATQFVGGPSAAEQFRFTVTNNDSSSCGAPTPAAWSPINSSGQMVVCGSTGGLSFLQSQNSLNMSLNLTIPYDSAFASGTNQVVTLTAIGTSVP